MTASTIIIQCFFFFFFFFYTGCFLITVVVKNISCVVQSEKLNI